jgi:hypothetical protein
MARPPRVGGFAAAKKRARIEDSDWGRLPVVAEEDLVLLKRTNRPQDYAVISRLAMLRISEIAGSAKPPRTLIRWASCNAFSVEDLADLVHRFSSYLRPTDGVAPRATRRLLTLHKRAVEPSPADIAFAERELLRAMAASIEAGRAYWIPRLRELRHLRKTGRLWPEGTLVADLISG